jgi:hypothetical protein
MFKIIKLRLPLDPDAIPETASGGWLPVIAGLGGHEVTDQLRKRWSSFQIPYLRNFSAAILSRELKCLSIDSQGNQWLTFEDEWSDLHVAPPAQIPAEIQASFPFHQIPGLEDFIKNFGGLANWNLPPCPWFLPASDCHVVAKDCQYYDWGKIGEWAGSLALYNTGTGNTIVVSPADRCAKWDHDIGWGSGDEDPFEDLNWNMSELIEQFIAYLSLDDNEAEESPFYY